RGRGNRGVEEGGAAAAGAGAGMRLFVGADVCAAPGSADKQGVYLLPVLKPRSGEDGMPPLRQNPAPVPVRRASAARSRRTLLWGLAWFVLVQAGLFAAMQLWAPHWLDPEYGAKAARLRRRLSAPGDRPFFIAALGSSLTDFGLRGRPVEQTLEQALGRPVLVANFGVPGAGPFCEFIHLRRILAEAGRPDLIL